MFFSIKVVLHVMFSFYCIFYLDALVRLKSVYVFSSVSERALQSVDELQNFSNFSSFSQHPLFIDLEKR